MGNSKDNQSDLGGDILVEERVRTKKPKMFAVILLNDDYTPMDFVIWLIQSIFHKSESEATRLMLDIHQKGKGLCGVFTYDVAQTKMLQAKNMAQKNEHPLECIVEPV